MRIATTMTTRFDLNARRMDECGDDDCARARERETDGRRWRAEGGSVGAGVMGAGGGGGKGWGGESRGGGGGVAGVHETKEAATVDGATRVVRGSGAVGERARVY